MEMLKEFLDKLEDNMSEDPFFFFCFTVTAIMFICILIAALVTIHPLLLGIFPIMMSIYTIYKIIKLSVSKNDS